MLLLRLVVGGCASLQAGLIIAASHGMLDKVAVAAAIVIIIGLAVIIGFATPFASALLGGVGLLVTASPGIANHLPLFASWMARAEFIAMSAALIPMGPGAFSLDARLYGRREIDLPGRES